MAGVDGPITELDIELSGILLEVGNIVLNGVLGSFSNVIGSHFNYSVPTLAVSSAIAETFTELVKTTEAGPVKQILLADVNFRIAKHQIEGSILVVFDLDDVRKLIRSLIEVES